MKSRGGHSATPAPDDAFERRTRWLIRVDGFDHGPFTPAEIRERIRDGRLTLRSDICEERDGRWIRLEDVPQYEAFCAQLVVEARERAEQEAMDRAENQVRREHKVASHLPHFIIGGSLVAAAVVAYLLTAAPNVQPSNYGGAIFFSAELGRIEPWAQFTGEREHEWRFGPEAPPADMSKPRRASARRRAYLRRDKVYEDSAVPVMDLSFDFDAEEESSRRTVSAAEIQAEVRPQASRLLRKCLVEEVARRPEVTGASFGFVLLPNGRVAHPRVSGAMTGRMHECTRRSLRKVRVEPFAGGPKQLSLSLQVSR